MKFYDFYWKVWQTENRAVVREKIYESLIVEYFGDETKLLLGSTFVTVFPFFQDEEEGYYSFLPTVFDGEMCNMWMDRENNMIYSVAPDGVVEVFTTNLVFGQIQNMPPPRK